MCGTQACIEKLRTWPLPVACCPTRYSTRSFRLSAARQGVASCSRAADHQAAAFDAQAKAALGADRAATDGATAATDEGAAAGRTLEVGRAFLAGALAGATFCSRTVDQPFALGRRLRRTKIAFERGKPFKHRGELERGTALQGAAQRRASDAQAQGRQTPPASCVTRLAHTASAHQPRQKAAQAQGVRPAAGYPRKALESVQAGYAASLRCRLRPVKDATEVFC